MLYHDEIPVTLNSRLKALQPYPLEKLAELFRQGKAVSSQKHIDLSIGEPKHQPPKAIQHVLREGLSDLSCYPNTTGGLPVRLAICNWLKRRYKINELDPETQVLPTLGSREALFSLVQAVVDSAVGKGLVLCPNPFYQIYEGAALLAGAEPYFINTVPEEDFRLDWSSVPEEIWEKVRLVFVCSPGNPTGKVLALEDWQELFDLSDRYGFVIASDECYSEIYFNDTPPLGVLEASEILGRRSFSRIVALGSLSKRSNVPGLRSGFIAGDPVIIKSFTKYRTYHGSAMGGLIQKVSEELWRDETHAVENRRLYRKKLDAFYEIVNPVLKLRRPEASFYFWARVPIDDRGFCLQLKNEQNVSALPGSFLSRIVDGVNPGENYIRIALVPSLDDCEEAAHRLCSFVRSTLGRGLKTGHTELACEA